MQTKHEVVITGIGVITPLGCSYEEVWQNMMSGKNGVSVFPESYYSMAEENVYVGGLCPEVSFDDITYLDKRAKRNLQKLNRATKMAIFSGMKALADAGIDVQDDCSKLNIGSILGTGTALADRYDGISFADRNPKWFLETYPNLINGYLSIYASLTGYGSTIVNACVGGTQAIGEAFKKIQYGEEEIMLAGGVDDKMSKVYASGFSRLGMSSISDDPEKACRPFDQSRDGLVMGQGACCFILESLESAKRRNVPIKGRVVGYGNAMDAKSIIETSSDGKARAMQRAIKDANIQPTDIGYISAHGTSTQNNDMEESLAIQKVFGEYATKIPISSTKSFLGHTFAACGALQTMICMKSLEEQRVHGNRNFRKTDIDLNLDYVEGIYRNVSMEYCMVNTSGLGGFNSSLVLRKV